MSGYDRSAPVSKGWRDEFVRAGGTLHSPRSVSESGTVFLAIDSSGSMAGLPLSQACQGSLNFGKAAVADNWAVGLVTFDSSVTECVGPTRDLKDIERSLPSVAFGSTAMHLAISHIAGKMRRGRSGKAVCVVSDGQPDDPEATLAAAEMAKLLGIQILCIGIEGSDHAFLRKLATSEVNFLGSKVASLPSDMARVTRLLVKGND